MQAGYFRIVIDEFENLTGHGWIGCDETIEKAQEHLVSLLQVAEAAPEHMPRCSQTSLDRET
jgi:hypothetical protein